jgi:hypothetical protein
MFEFFCFFLWTFFLFILFPTFKLQHATIWMFTTENTQAPAHDVITIKSLLIPLFRTLLQTVGEGDIIIRSWFPTANSVGAARGTVDKENADRVYFHENLSGLVTSYSQTLVVYSRIGITRNRRKQLWPKQKRNSISTVATGGIFQQKQTTTTK